MSSKGTGNGGGLFKSVADSCGVYEYAGIKTAAAHSTLRYCTTAVGYYKQLNELVNLVVPAGTYDVERC